MPRSKSTKSRTKSRTRSKKSRPRKYKYKGYYDGPVVRSSPKRASPKPRSVPSTPQRRPQFIPGTTPRTTNVQFGNEIGVTPSRLQFDFKSPSIQ